MTKANPTYNLNNAFNVAEDRLGLTRLLDPEGRCLAKEIIIIVVVIILVIIIMRVFN